jgi:putative heme-binding domain-containing protein
LLTAEGDVPALWVMLLLLQQAQELEVPTVNRNPFTTPADVAQGKKLYGGRCAGCHGPFGNGGKGANLAVPSLARARSDLGLYRVIRYGIPETEMPAHNMTQREIWQIAAYVRTLGASSEDRTAGDAARGRAIFSGKGRCLQCHAVGTEGGTAGPSLSDIGRRRGPGFLRNKLADSAGTVADDFRTVQVTTRDGRKLSGVRMNEDSWSIQFRDLTGALYSFWKQDLSDLQVARKTPMPSYGNLLEKQEVDDLVAYLSELRGFN